MRKLTEHPERTEEAKPTEAVAADAQRAAATPDDGQQAVDEDSKRLGVKKWIPYMGPNTLAKAKYKVKDRMYKDTDGSVKSFPQTVLEKAGEPAYLVYENQLLERREGYGGVKQRLVTTFKTRFPDTPDGRARRSRQSAFRAMLRSRGIPGA